jgi:hypothetical protein
LIVRINAVTSQVHFGATEPYRFCDLSGLSEFRVELSRYGLVEQIQKIISSQVLRCRRMCSCPVDLHQVLVERLADFLGTFRDTRLGSLLGVLRHVSYQHFVSRDAEHLPEIIFMLVIAMP